MQVLQVMGRDFPYFGAAVSAYRLYCGLRTAGVDVRFLCQQKRLDSSIEIPRSPRVERLISQITSRLGFNDVHCVGSFKVKSLKAYLDADIIHFHGIHGQYFSYLALPTLTRDKTAVFTLRDMWALTGRCSFSYDCERWKIGCGQCPHPDLSPVSASNFDASGLEWKLKNWIYSHSKFAVVALDKRMVERAKQSMLKHFPIVHIPNGVDTYAYQPLDPHLCRKALGIPVSKRVLMFAAANLSRKRKGGALLVKALRSLPPSLKSEIVLVLLGEQGDAIAGSVDLQTLSLGYVDGHRLKALAYSAADILVFPTQDEGLPNVLLESMACGCPMVATDAGGVPDVVRPGVTGHLAAAEDWEDLRDGIVSLLEDEPLRRRLGEQCRQIALNEYSVDLEIKRHIELYQRLLQNEADKTMNRSYTAPLETVASVRASKIASRETSTLNGNVKMSCQD
ncbi:MAG: glycosyltransferase [Candidatus Binatia bacterium]